MDFWSNQQWRDLDTQLCKEFEEIEKKEEESEKRKQAKKNLQQKISGKSKTTDKSSKYVKEKNALRENGRKKQEKNNKESKKVKTETIQNERTDKNQAETIDEEGNVDDDDEWQVLKFPTPTVIFRGGWAALPPKSPLIPLQHPVRRIIFTFTGGDECFSDEECMATVQRLQEQHMAKGMPDIQFNFLVGGDQCVYEGRGWLSKATKKPIHSHFDNENTIDIAYIGDFTDQDPRPAVIEAANGILQLGVNENFLNPEMFITSIRDEQSEKVILNEMEKEKGAPIP